MADIVNLRRARKGKNRATKAREGDANAARHGRTKAEHAGFAAQAERLARALDGHRRDRETDSKGAGGDGA